MERFVFVAAITVAVIVALSYSVSQMPWSVQIDGIDHRRDPVFDVAAGRIEPQAFATSSIAVRHAAARIVITPEDRIDVSVEIENPGRLPMPELEFDDNRLTIDGRLGGRVGDCGEESVDVRGYGDIAEAELPLVTIRAPRALSFDMHGASRAEIGPSQAFKGSFSGCGDARIGDVADDLELDIAGSGEIVAGSARELSANLAGSAELQAGAIAEGADLDLAGAGEVRLASVSGALNISTAGSGEVEIAGGALSSADIEIAGSGDVSIAAPIERLSADIVGSGAIDVAATVGDIDADIAGSGGVRVQSMTGNLSQDVFGSGRVEIGSRAPAAPAQVQSPEAVPPAPTPPPAAPGIP